MSVSRGPNSFDEEKNQPTSEVHPIGTHDVPVDKALDLLEHVDGFVADPAKMAALLWRIDRRLMPVMCLCEFFNVSGHEFK